VLATSNRLAILVSVGENAVARNLFERWAEAERQIRLSGRSGRPPLPRPRGVVAEPLDDLV
jgi:hypothetical protein